MKKLFLILGLCATIAMLGTSCNKSCTCKTYLNGQVTLTTEVNLDDVPYDKCSDMDNFIEVDGNITGLQCK